MKKIVLFGAGRGTRDVLQLIRQINAKKASWQVLGFVDRNPDLRGKVIDGLPVLGDSYNLPAKAEVYGITGVQVPQLRQKIVSDEIEGQGFKLATLIHPSIEVPEDASIKEGCVIYPGVIIASNVSLGKSVLVNYNTLLGIDLRVGDYTFIGPLVNITGSCTIGRECVIGASSVLVPGCLIGERSIVGMGTAVFSNIPSGTSVTDIPRKISREVSQKPARVSL